MPAFQCPQFLAMFLEIEKQRDNRLLISIHVTELKVESNKNKLEILTGVQNFLYYIGIVIQGCDINRSLVMSISFVYIRFCWKQPFDYFNIVAFYCKKKWRGSIAILNVRKIMKELRIF